MNYDRITIEDCMDNYQYKDTATLLCDGMVAGFLPERENYDEQWKNALKRGK